MRAAGASEADLRVVAHHAHQMGAAVEASSRSLLAGCHAALQDLVTARPASSASRPGPVYRRIRNEGPMDGFGYSWFDDHLAQAHLPRPRLLAREPDGEGAPFGYEALNLVDGHRSVGEIRDALAATVGAAPIEEVAEYLDTLARLGVIAPVGR